MEKQWTIKSLFENGVFENLHELVYALSIFLKDDKRFNSKWDVLHTKEERQEWRKYEDHPSKLDSLVNNYEEFLKLTLDESNPEEIKYWFAELCFFYCLFYVFNLYNRSNVKFEKELADVKNGIKHCIKLLVNEGAIQSQGYYSHFNPHPDYCRNPPEKFEFFKRAKDEYEKIIKNDEIDDTYFPFVLYMILEDFKDKALPPCGFLTKNYPIHYLIGLSKWIAYSQDEKYYNSMINNYVINYFHFFTSYQGKQPTFYIWDNVQQSMLEEEKNHAYQGLLEIAFVNKGTLGLWLHYDTLFKNENPKKEELLKLVFGEWFFTSNESEHFAECFESLIGNMNYGENPGIVLAMYLALKKMDVMDLKKILKKHKSDSNAMLFQCLFYFLIWDLASSYRNTISARVHKADDDGRSWDEDSLDENPLYPFYKPFYKPIQDGSWYKPEVIEGVLNEIGKNSLFGNAQTKFVALDFSKLKSGNFDCFETLGSMIGTLSHSDESDTIKIQIDAIKSIQEKSINCIPNIRKSYSDDGERKSIKSRCEKNKAFLEKTDVGFMINDFSQYFYEPGFENTFFIKKCKCKFLAETDSKNIITNRDNCRLNVDPELRFRSAFYNNFYCTYLNYHRNMITHNSYYSPISYLLFGNLDKKFVLTSLHDIKVQLLRMKNEYDEIIQRLLTKADDVFEMIVTKYFPELEGENKWEKFFRDSFSDDMAEICMDRERMNRFSQDFDIQADFSVNEIQEIIDFFNFVWNVDFLKKSPDGIYTNPNFLKKYEGQIKFYEIYLTLAFQKYDGEIMEENKK